jgi:hypothetical protein
MPELFRMRPKDVWFLGLAALVILSLASPPTDRAMSEDDLSLRPLPPEADPSRSGEASRRLLPARVVPRAVCPRDALHPVTHRADGAIWCRGCDEAFYPQLAIWKVIMQPAGV